jgi:phytoene dehydrogenase-like protein
VDSNQHPCVIIGAGPAGLACAWRLTQLGRRCLILEAADDVGGRVRTDLVDGFRLDRGFQVLLSSYPQTARVVDFDRLDLRPFKAGAIVRRAGRFHRAFDPLRHPTDLLATATTPLLSIGDKVRLGRLWAEVLGTSPANLLTTGPERTTGEELAARGFSPPSIEAFFRPFFGGVFLQSRLATSSRFFKYLFRMFATGRAVVPADGMGAIPHQLAGRLKAAGVEIRLNSRVVGRSAAGVALSTGERLTASAVVVATDLPAARRLIPDLSAVAVGTARSALTLWFDSPSPVVNSPTLVLNGDGEGPVNHLAEMSAVSERYAPAGRSLVAASVLDGDPGDPELESSVRHQMAGWIGPGAASWRLLRIDRIPFALPPAEPPTFSQPARSPRVGEGLFVCGDHTEHPSIEGAIVSGIRAADAIAESPI